VLLMMALVHFWSTSTVLLKCRAGFLKFVVIVASCEWASCYSVGLVDVAVLVYRMEC
jgi:hypothetical protein